MRPYRIVEETLEDDEEYLRVVPVGEDSRLRSTPLDQEPHLQAWTPRNMDLPAGTRRQGPAPPPVPAGLTTTQRWMIGGFVIICVGMVLGMLMVRIWDVASQAVAALPPEGSSQPARSATAAPPPAAKPADATAADAPPAAEPGAITTEIRVLQPNYTVAPGDTLGIIARRHGASVDALASINNLENRNSLRVGQRLIIP